MKTIKGVYCLTSPSGKRYVGIGMGRKGIEGRWYKYKNYDCKCQKKLYNALKKHGPENFKYEVILETDDIERAKKVEQQLIALWNLQSNQHGYNITAGGDSPPTTKGKKLSLETRAKMSNSAKGRVFSEECRRKISEANRNRTHSIESRKKMSEAAKKRVATDETRKKISDSITSSWKNRKL